MTNQFFGFSPEAFEQFVRALALSVFGPGVTAFGNGPDGGREATFRGEVPYPHPPATQWSGYGVIQAKCKEKTEGTEKDQKWAIKQLREELETFVSSENRNPKPEYYVFVTNVELSSTAGGGKDKADELLRSYYGKLPIKDHAVWDANQLNAFLTTYKDLRRRFCAYLTPGDVLGVMLADIERRTPNATRILAAFLERELRADGASRLDQAGDRTDEQLRLARLFIDLPASDEPQLVPPDEKPDADGRFPHGVLWELLRGGSRKLDPKTLYDQETSTSNDKSERFPTRYVLLGGPGSGKSTVGQFLAQIHRSALLTRRKQRLLGPDTRQIIREIHDLCDNQGFPWPTTPRYPFKVELNRFAKALASEESDHVESLSQYLLNSLSPDQSITHDDLLEWLGIYPWLLILDGLDEVPATSNRDTLVSAVNDFLAEARQVEADLYVVATSRQQGYGGEFGSGVVAFRHILPLSRPRALLYVGRYANARFGSTNPTKEREVVEKLRESTKRELTAQLMASPLQVTFMVTVVAARGDPGEDRWQLFESYYRTIYDRERQKAVPPYDQVLSKQQPTIDRLHHDIGFWLQYRSETAAGAGVSLPISQFELLVDAYLNELGHEGTEKEELVTLITDTARHRLVFLTSRVEGELSFDVRSLQEYMAAECLMTGDAKIITPRLKAIAPVAYWRNVFLFAASKCFADTRSRHLQDEIGTLCEGLNTSTDALLVATRAGSELALDILSSGAVAENPNHTRHLARIALDLLSQPYLTGGPEQGASADQRMAIVYSEVLKTVYREQLELRIGQTDVNRTIGAWPLLMRLISRGVDWAVDLSNNRWPTETKTQETLLDRTPLDLGRIPWIWKNVSETIWCIPPAEAKNILLNVQIMPSLAGDVSDPLADLARLVSRWSDQLQIPVNVQHVNKTPFYMAITPAFSYEAEYKSLPRLLTRVPPVHPGWLPFLLVNKFLTSPNAQTLANVLNECANGGWDPSDKTCLDYLPWPMANCLLAVRSLEDLRKLAQQIAKGALGDSPQWTATEERWRSEGIALQDLIPLSREALGLDGSSGNLGLPAKTNGLASRRNFSPSALLELFQTAQRMQSSGHKGTVVWFLCMAGTGSDGFPDCVPPAKFGELWEGLPVRRMWYQNCVAYPDDPKAVGPWLDFFDWLGRSDILIPDLRSTEYDKAWCDCFEDAFITDRTEQDLSAQSGFRTPQPRLGLLRLLGRLASTGYSIETVPPEMLNVDSFAEPRFKLAALLVRLSQPTLTEELATRIADESVILLDPPAERGAGDLLILTADAHLDRIPAIEQFLLRLHERMPPTVRLGIAYCERLLRRALRRRASELQRAGQLEKLELPVVHAP